MDEKMTREDMISEIECYCEAIGMPFPEGFPDQVSDDEMEAWIWSWSEYDPCPELN